MTSASDNRRTKDITVLRLLTTLVKETDRLIRLADDIDAHGTTPEARTVFSLIGKEVYKILDIMHTSLEPLYKLYEFDPGMKNLDQERLDSKSEGSDETGVRSYDLQTLWRDSKETDPGSQ